MALTRNMLAAWAQTGLAGTLAYAVSADDGAALQARTTAGVVELPAGSGVYAALIDPAWSGRIVWDDGVNFTGEAFESGRGGSGSGAFARTVTVTASATAVAGAVVGMFNGAIMYTATTDISGIAAFSLDNGSYTLTVSKAGYSFTPETVVVSANGDTAASITAIVIAPAADPPRTNAFLTTYDMNGAIASGVPITLQLIQTADHAAGLSHSIKLRTAFSDANGLVQFSGLLRNAIYRGRRGEDGPAVDFATADVGTTPLPEILGQE